MMGFWEQLTKLLGKAIPDGTKVVELIAEAKMLAAKNEHALLTGQIEINKIEAQGNWFQRGWRPAIGWACAAWVVYEGMLRSILTGLTGIEFPATNEALMTPILLSMLGMVGFRSWEKLGKMRIAKDITEKKLQEGEL